VESRHTQQLLQHTNLFLQVFDDILLVVVDPASQADEEELQMVHRRILTILVADASFGTVRRNVNEGNTGQRW